MANTAVLAIKILADASNAAKTMDVASGKANKFSASLAKVAIPAAAIAAGLFAMTKSAVEDAQSQAMLAAALRKTAGATDASIASTEAWINKTALATGVADDQLRPALATLARATGDVAKSQQIMSTALDVSAATGKPLEAVTAALAKAYGGQTTALAKLVPGLDKGVLKSGDFTKVMAELAAKMGGSAATAAETAGGKLRRMTLALDEAQESIGGAFLPIVEKVAPALMSVAGWMQENSTAVLVLVGVLGTLAVIVGVVSAATKVYTTWQTIQKVLTKAQTTEQWKLNAALTANPIGLIVAAIAALIGVLILAYKNSQTFRNIVQTAFKVVAFYAQVLRVVVTAAVNGVRNAISAAWNWLKSNVFGPWAAAFQAVAAAAVAAVGKIKAAWQAIKDAIFAAWKWIDDHVFGPFRRAIEKVVSWLEKIKIPKWVQWVIDTGSSLFGGGKSAAAAAPTVPTTGRGARAATVTGAPGGARLSFGSLVINVDLDGKRVGGAVRRIVAEVLDDEGFALVSGTWG